MDMFYAVSIKGCASVMFDSYKKDMDTAKIWSIIKSLMRIKPKKVGLSYSASRSALADNREEDKGKKELIVKIIDGCIDTEKPYISEGSSVDIYLGKCSKYSLPFGTVNKDTGHISIIMVLPFLTEGCYNLGVNTQGTVRKSSSLDNYILDVDIEVYIRPVNKQEALDALNKGVRVYPFKIKNPELFDKDSETSDGESMNASTDEEEHAASPTHSKNNNIMPRTARSNTRRRSLLKVAGGNMKKGIRARMNEKQKEVLRYVTGNPPINSRNDEDSQNRESSPVPSTSAPA